ncbi:hypothetical protein AWB77_03744 [Caballeronia fortuita]|uniref:Uncharacterized protein n=2 Tax=Caballeronia fortuita TaxID=1777138 RepID=A0A158C8N8_9BURK|nr:hypothetical protein AWB77_03744 [Caballeronia fortuita]
MLPSGDSYEAVVRSSNGAFPSPATSRGTFATNGPMARSASRNRSFGNAVSGYRVAIVALNDSFVPELPMTTTGEVIRESLRAQFKPAREGDDE